MHAYLGLSNNSFSTLAKHPGSAAKAEYSLRTFDPRGSIVLISKFASPLSSGHPEQRLLTRASRSVYDFDDAIMYEHRKLGISRARLWQKCVTSADVVIAGNEYLAEQVASTAPTATIKVIPTCVDLADYQEKTSFETGPTPRLVWLGSPSTEEQLLAITEALLEVHRHTGARLTVISRGNADIGRLRQMVDRVEWSPASAKNVSDADVGLMPLRDNPYTRGKCGYKLLQYSAAALPSVASPVGVNASILRHTKQRAAITQQDWVDQIIDLLTCDSNQRESLGTHARTVTAEQYSYATWQATWTQTVLNT